MPASEYKPTKYIVKQSCANVQANIWSLIMATMSMQGCSKVFTTGQARFNLEHSAIK